MKFFIKLFTLVVALLLFASGCSSHTDRPPVQTQNDINPFEDNSTRDDSSIRSESLEQLIQSAISIKYGKHVKSTKIDTTMYEGNLVFASFYFEYQKKPYIGFIYSEVNHNIWNLGSMELFPADLAQDFSIVNAKGQLKDLIRKYQVVFGYLNNEQIQEMQIMYQTNEMNILKIAQGQKTYMDVTLGDIPKLLKVVARNGNGETIYKYEYD